MIEEDAKSENCRKYKKSVTCRRQRRSSQLRRRGGTETHSVDTPFLEPQAATELPPIQPRSHSVPLPHHPASPTAPHSPHRPLYHSAVACPRPTPATLSSVSPSLAAVATPPSSCHSVHPSLTQDERATSLAPLRSIDRRLAKDDRGWHCG